MIYYYQESSLIYCKFMLVYIFIDFMMDDESFYMHRFVLLVYDTEYMKLSYNTEKLSTQKFCCNYLLLR